MDRKFLAQENQSKVSAEGNRYEREADLPTQEELKND